MNAEKLVGLFQWISSFKSRMFASNAFDLIRSWYWTVDLLTASDQGRVKMLKLLLFIYPAWSEHFAAQLRL